LAAFVLAAVLLLAAPLRGVSNFPLAMMLSTFDTAARRTAKFIPNTIRQFNIYYIAPSIGNATLNSPESLVLYNNLRSGRCL
jgi:hypothetical protein